MKDEIIVWVDVDQADKISKASGFIPVMEYQSVLDLNCWEFGKIENQVLIIRFRVTSFVKYIRGIFGDK
jgi:hypothetical protein